MTCRKGSRGPYRPTTWDELTWVAPLLPFAVVAIFVGVPPALPTEVAAIPTWVLTVVGVAAVVSACAFGAFTYVPPSGTCEVHVNAVSTRSVRGSPPSTVSPGGPPIGLGADSVWSMPTPASLVKIELAEKLAADYGGVLSRRQLAELGIGRGPIARLVRDRRWALRGRWTIAVHCGSLEPTGNFWRAVHEVGGSALVDGTSALRAAGLRGLDDDVVHVSVHMRERSPDVPGVVIHKVSRRPADDRIPSGLPRTRPSLAALRATQWATSDRQAALFLVMPVQQRLVTGEHLRAMHVEYTGRRRRALVATLIDDIVDGAQSLGELDFAGLCRTRGLPVPERQVVVTGPDGRCYLDVRWREGLVVEIDGRQHFEGVASVADMLRQNELAMRGDMTLRIPLLGLRVDADAFLDQVEQALQVLSLRSAS